MHRLTLIWGILVLPFAAAASEKSQLNDLEKSAGKNPTALIELGDLYLEAMQLADAKRIYQKALGYSKKQQIGEVSFGLARLEIANGQNQKAKNICRNISFKHKLTTVSAVCEGWVWLSMDRSARAIEEFEKAVAGNDIARGKTGIAEALRRQTEYDKAIFTYNEAVTAGAGHVAWLGLGLTKEIKGDKSGAMEAFEKAAQAQPSSCLAHYHYGRLLKKGPEAMSHLRTAIAIRPGWADAYVGLGDAYLSDGDLNSAMAEYQNAIRADAKCGWAYWGLGRVLSKLDKKTQARKALGSAIEFSPDLVEAYLVLSDIEYDMGDFDASLKTLEKARTVATGNVEVHLKSGIVYFSLGRYTSARSHLNRAIALKSDLSKAFYLLGDIACERRLFDEGRSYYDSALAGDMVGVDRNDIIHKKASCASNR
jgi:tetratricopeptide (TPR) repeat protein